MFQKFFVRSHFVSLGSSGFGAAGGGGVFVVDLTVDSGLILFSMAIFFSENFEISASIFVNSDFSFAISALPFETFVVCDGGGFCFMYKNFSHSLCKFDLRL